MRLFTPFRFLLFRIFVLTIGRNVAGNNWVKRHIIIGLVIPRRQRSAMRAIREFTFAEDGLTIRDELTGLAKISAVRLRAADIFTTIYMGSSKYYRHMESLTDRLSDKNLIDLIRASGGVLTYQIKDDGLNLKQDGKEGGA